MKIIGIIMMAIPALAIFVVSCITWGWKPTTLIWLIVGAGFACFYFGVKFVLR